MRGLFIEMSLLAAFLLLLCLFLCSLRPFVFALFLSILLFPPKSRDLLIFIHKNTDRWGRYI